MKNEMSKTETQTIAGRQYQVVEGLGNIDGADDCKKCAFTFGIYPCIDVTCAAAERDDGREVYFVEVKNG